MFDETLRKVAEQAVEEAITLAAKKMIANHVGCGIDDEVKRCIKEEAMRLLREDEELKTTLRNSLLHWITKSVR